MTGRRLLLGLALLAVISPATTSLAAAIGRNGAVAAEHRLASEAGVEILRAGGNAVDAAAAAVLASGVVNPSSSGIGGGGFMVIYRADDSRAHTVDFREAAPRRADRNFYVRDGKVDAAASKRGGTAVAVPGEVAGLALALDRFGSKTLAEVAAPAIRLARDGFVVEEHLARMIGFVRKALATDAELARTFLHDDGSPYRAGELLKRPRLARTLELLATQGPPAFYGGDVARDIAATIRKSGGVLDEEDLGAYRPVLRPPVIGSYGRRKIIGMAPPSSGGGVITETLNVLGPYKPRDLGRDSSTYLHVVAESLKAAFADRAQWYGDPDFVRVPLERLVSAQHASKIRARISAVSAVPSEEYGRAVAAAAGAGTAHISVIDRDGNAAAVTSSVNTPFGALVSVPGRDIVLNNTMDDFSAQPGVPNAYGLVGSEANAIAPGKRPLSSMSPLIVLEDGSVRLVAGASGGPRIISATLQVLLDVLEFSMPVGPAVKAPRIHHQWLPDVLEIEKGIAPPVRQSLARRGHKIDELEHGAAVQAVEVVTDREGRLVRAASDARKGGKAVAY